MSELLVHLLECNYPDEPCYCKEIEELEKKQKRDFLHYDWIFQGIRFDFPFCCIFFFCNVWNNDFKKKIGNENMYGWSLPEGRVFCPDCIAKRLEK